MIDSHHHIWRQRDLPWLRGPEQPRIFGEYGTIRRDYLIEEYLADIQRTGIEKSVYVQANWAPEEFENEVAWVSSVAESSGWPHAVVGYADFTRPDLPGQLAALTKYPLMRGIRQQFHWHRNPQYRFAARPDLLAEPEVKRGIRRLAEYGWCFDLQVFPGQMDAAAELARSCEQVTFVLQHAGMLEDTSAEGWELWRSGMRKLAGCSNVVAKLSAFGSFIRRNDPGFVAAMVSETAGLFGADRCMFGSNFPIEKIWTGFNEMFDSFESAAVGFSDAERTEIFSGTAERVYRI